MTAGAATSLADPFPDVSQAPERLCERCGYDLRALPVDRCPECGLQFDPAAAPLPRIPWLRRRVVGRVAAFWETVAMTTFSPRVFAAEFLRASRVATRDARRFRAGCVWLAVASVVAVYMAAALPTRTRGTQWPEVAVLALGVVIAGRVFFGLLAATGPFDPLQTTLTGEHVWLNALNGYASSPLAFSPVPAAAACAAIPLLRAGGALRDAGAALVLLACAGVIAQGVAMWLVGLAMIRQVRRHTWGDMIWPALGLPLRWVICGFLTFVVMVVMAFPLGLLTWLFESV